MIFIPYFFKDTSIIKERYRFIDISFGIFDTTAYLSPSFG